MRKLGWFAVSALVMAVIVSGVLLLAANLYVQSQGSQQRIRQTLNDALHVTVTLKKTTVTPWSGLRLEGITLQAPMVPGASADQTRGGNFLSAESFRVGVAWWPLLTRGRIHIEEILLENPQLAWAQDADGRWEWPTGTPAVAHKKPRAERGPDEAPIEPANVPPPPEAGTPVAPANQNPIPGVKEHRESWHDDASMVKRFKLRRGSLDFQNEHGTSLGRFDGVDLDGRLLDEEHAAGRLRFHQAAFARTALQLRNFRSAFAYDAAEGLSISGGKGELAGGELLVDYKLRTHEPGSPFSAECRLANVDLSELIRQAGSRMRLMEGRLQGEVSMEGLSDDPNQRKATGQLRLVGAQFMDFPVLKLLGEVLRIEDLSHLEFKKAELDCRLEGSDLQIIPINLVSNNLQVWVQGRYSTSEDQLALHGKLVIDPAVSHQLPQFIEMNFTSCGEEAPGSRYIEFDVTGPLGKPNSNLFDRVLAGPTSGLLQNLLAPKPKKPRTKHPKDEGQASPPPAPGESAAH